MLAMVSVPRLAAVMALFGTILTVNAVLVNDRRFAAALAYVDEVRRAGSLARQRLEALTTGASDKIELTEGAFAIEQVYPPKRRAEGFFESHRKYIDVQVIVAGEELMEVEDVSRLVVTDAYHPERDLIKYADTAAASVLRMRAGDAAVFFPVDGHMPSLDWRGAGLVRKTVVKVPV